MGLFSWKKKESTKDKPAEKKTIQEELADYVDRNKQADILYRLLTEQMTKAEIKGESEDKK